MFCSSIFYYLVFQPHQLSAIGIYWLLNRIVNLRFHHIRNFQLRFVNRVYFRCLDLHYHKSVFGSLFSSWFFKPNLNHDNMKFSNSNYLMIEGVKELCQTSAVEALCFKNTSSYPKDHFLSILFLEKHNFKGKTSK